MAFVGRFQSCSPSTSSFLLLPSVPAAQPTPDPGQRRKHTACTHGPSRKRSCSLLLSNAAFLARKRVWRLSNCVSLPAPLPALERATVRGATASVPETARAPWPNTTLRLTQDVSFLPTTHTTQQILQHLTSEPSASAVASSSSSSSAAHAQPYQFETLELRRFFDGKEWEVSREPSRVFVLIAAPN